MSKKHQIKAIVLTALCAAVLTACGGGGSPSTASTSNAIIDNAKSARTVIEQIEALPSAEALTAADVAKVAAALNAFNALNSESKALVGKANTDKLQGLIDAANKLGNTASGNTAAGNPAAPAAGEISDNAPLAPLNLPTPLHTSFISSATAQQNNPNVQLRNIDAKHDFTYNQGGLISSLEFNQNAEVKLDGVVITNNTVAGAATQVNFTTPSSMIVKAFSGGTSAEDVSKQTGAVEGSNYAFGKANFDAKIETLYTDLEAAKKALASAADAAAQAEAQAKVDELQKSYDNYRALREALVGVTKDTVDSLAYFKKDKNGLVFDKKFDGVYIVQFTDGTRVVLHDSAAAGWTYQTFAHYIDPKNGVIHGYQSLGDETPFASLPPSGTATYNGLSTAYLVQPDGTKQLTSDVKAVADFAKKGVSFTTSNSHFHTLHNGVRTSTADNSYNMKGTAAWSNSNLFTGKVTAGNGMSGVLNGKFYGANAAEIGGTYSLKNSDGTGHLIGGYGAKRQ
ncbi:transferrin-binding protein-like solute binding protein [Neisseria sp.]|uniref:transferrin-binding protein-like solute binding protein n=1 Tax=Neisseria sp. TaxID=192066 RepID=UPI00359F88EB